MDPTPIQHVDVCIHVHTVFACTYICVVRVCVSTYTYMSVYVYM